MYTRFQCESCYKFFSQADECQAHEAACKHNIENIIGTISQVTGISISEKKAELLCEALNFLDIRFYTFISLLKIIYDF